MRPGRGFMENAYVRGGDWRVEDSASCSLFRAGRREIELFSQERTRRDSMSMPH
jgi:hypothetical protein